jgi:uncharacterized membrane protein YqiK
MASANTPAKSVKYLVCVDGREESLVGLKLACMKAGARNGSVDMLHVVAPADFQTLGAIAERMREERYNEGRTLLEKLAAHAQATYGILPNAILREGPTGDEIVAAAMSNADVITVVLGIAANQNNTRGKVAAWLASQLGSKLFIPLLLVPGNLTDEQLQNLI